jgi:hypothetical protein
MLASNSCCHDGSEGAPRIRDGFKGKLYACADRPALLGVSLQVHTPALSRDPQLQAVANAQTTSTILPSNL